ncbi:MULTISPECIES: DNA adenine methylase [unclassified Gilliamella]|uniref:DNA adenine methylase n=1 Tax=unclassified Gilliamella TaxID=2685620 RepID=UPI00226AD3AA|nr:MULTISPECIES: DNA adenine methylase [unclassified Gilliamella]MCX8600773.1 DNA adenine methylase [Gilliamella sp. B3722]MCX8607791.1 DNA adenine methylase [Gilliamella sp. B3771]MCX8609993.1 DNA adenine methylase [Gilliamella sp. B3891]MCX8612747.1 DNA adenine methylase [Gilliamella sp. B3773]MCX8615981.1 DNA adenine methylase [Gilliamella sp. B3770]
MHYSPLRYPGGKSKFSPYIKNIIETNNIVGCDYYEIYAGGAGVALNLLIDGICKNIHINDADPAIYSFWKSAIYDTENFLRLLNDTPITMDEWYKQKEIINNPLNNSELNLGFSAFFLNRTNRSGILKGGVIGGKKQDGIYRIDNRFKKLDLIKKIQLISGWAKNIFVTNLDASKLLTQINKTNNKNVFIYLDPPYYIKGQGLYRNFYNHDDHVKIREILDKARFHWLVSYDNNENIKDIYKQYRQREYSLNYSAQLKMKAKEIIIYCDSLKIPTN